jgi:hypothetical protein
VSACDLQKTRDAIENAASSFCVHRSTVKAKNNQKIQVSFIAVVKRRLIFILNMEKNLADLNFYGISFSDENNKTAEIG